MSGHDSRTRQISQLEVELANQRAKFDGWLVENSTMSGQSAYEEYVEQFRTWEEDMQRKLKDLRLSITKQPVAEIPTLPTRNLDDQIADSLNNVSMNDFIKALMVLAKNDTGFISKLTKVSSREYLCCVKVIQRETQGTGFYNLLLPIPSAQSLASIPVIPSFPVTNNVQIPPPSVYGGPLPVRTTFLAYNSTSAHPIGPSATYQQPVYTQQTVHGAIPEGWVVDEAVRRQRKSPIPERQHLPKLPFKDFSQT